MANKPLKSIKFPGLADTYTVLQVDNAMSGSSTNPVQNKVIKGALDSIESDLEDVSTEVSQKADKDGVVASAKQLLSTQMVEDQAPYLFRTSGGSTDIGNREYLRKIVGGTVAWNQMMPELTASNYNVSNGAPSYSDGKLTINVTSVTNWIGIAKPPAFTVAGHKYFVSAKINSPKAINFTPNASGTEQSPMTTAGKATTVSTLRNASDSSAICMYLRASTAGCEVGDNIVIEELMYIDLTILFGSTIADYIYSIEQAHAGDGVAWFKKHFPKPYYEYNAGELLSVSGLQSHDMTGFNQFDKSTMVDGYIDDSNGVLSGNAPYASSDYIKVVPSQTYYVKTEQTSGLWGAWYDANKVYISYITNYGNATIVAPANACYVRLTIKTSGTGNPDTFCINLSDPSRNGQYKPYEKHSYPLDSTITLRGIPKLDANNQLYFDGDEYESDGSVTRRYGIMDLGTLSWRYAGAENHERFNTSSVVPNLKGAKSSVVANGICSAYVMTTNNGTYAHIADKTISLSETGYIYVHDTAYTDEIAFKTAMSGVMLVYELATPTTELAEPYSEVQICDAGGTEEFVTNSVVPVGHVTEYPTDLKKRIEGLPDDFSNLIAPVEKRFTATRNYSVGDFVIIDNYLYKVTSAISSGGTITPNSNVTATTIMAEILALA